MVLSPKMARIKLIVSYLIDWAILVALVAVGGGLSYVKPYHRPFSLLDLSISFPYQERDLVSTAVLVVLSLVAPAVVILIYTAALVPWPAKRSTMTRSAFWKRKAWECNAGWMGLGLSWALAFMITQGIKNLIGKPRPDLLSRCQPDLTDIASHVVGGFGQDLSQRWVLLSSSICTQTNTDIMNDGFRSFLSGHSSMSWSGLFYLSLWLASKLNLSIPYFHPRSMIEEKKAAEADQSSLLPIHSRHDTTPSSEPPFERAAAPPLFGVAIFLIPVSVAFWICSTRYVDFKHKGIDIFSGSLLGVITAWFGFRLYHGSLTRGETWAWSPRSADRAFAVSSGHEGWVGEGSAMSKRFVKNRQEEPATLSASTSS